MLGRKRRGIVTRAAGTNPSANRGRGIVNANDAIGKATAVAAVPETPPAPAAAKVAAFLRLNPFVHLLAPIQIDVRQARLDLPEVGRALCVSGVALLVHRMLAQTTIDSL